MNLTVASRIFIFTARRYASAVYAMVCLSLSVRQRPGILQKRLDRSRWRLAFAVGWRGPQYNHVLDGGLQPPGVTGASAIAAGIIHARSGRLSGNPTG